MQIGDKVHVTGTVRDIVGESVLMLTDDSIHQREYWFLAKHVEVLETAPAPPVEPPVEPALPPHPSHELPEPPALPGHDLPEPPVPDQSLPGEPEPPVAQPRGARRR